MKRGLVQCVVGMALPLGLLIVLGLLVQAAPGNGASLQADASPLTITKRASSDSVCSGGSLMYAIVVSNTADQAASTVVVTDSLDPHVTLAASDTSTSALSCVLTDTDSVVVCSMATMPGESHETITLTVDVTATFAGPLANVATVDSDGTEPVSSDPVSTAVIASADLEMAKTALPATVTAGQNLTYTLVVTNHGPLSATGVKVTDTLPVSVTFVSATTGEATYDQGLHRVYWTVGTLDPNQPATLGIVVSVSPEAEGTIQNSAVVGSNACDPGPAPNQDSVSTSVVVETDLKISKDDSPDPVDAGAPLVYTLVVSNDGPSTAKQVVVTDTLPAGVEFVEANEKGTESGGIVTWNLGNLPKGSQVLVLKVQVSENPPTTMLVNKAGVHSKDGATIVVTETTDVIVVDLEIVKADSPDPVIAGQPVTYDLVVTNHGPSTATGVQVTDTLPLSVTYAWAEPEPASVVGAVVVWNLGELAQYESKDVTMVVTPDHWIDTILTNTANVSASEPDSDLSSNRAEITTTVKPLCEVVQVTTTLADVVNEWPTIGGLGSETRVAYLSDKQLWISTLANLSSPLAVTASPPTVTNEFPAISGDGNHVAFVSDGDYDLLRPNADGSAEIFRYDVGGGFRNVTDNYGSLFPGFVLAPSPDETAGRIAFASDYDYTGQNMDANLEIWMYDAVQGILQVTKSTGCTNGHVATSGNGRYVAFLSDGNLDASGGNEDHSLELYAARVPDAGDTTITQITHNAAGISVGQPSISNDGSRIAFLVQGQVWVAHLELAGLAVSELVQIPASGSVSDPVLSGDGRTVAFVSTGDLDPNRGNGDGTPELYLAAVYEPGKFTQVTAAGEGVANSAPSINRDGTQIAFVSDVDGNGEVWVATCRPDYTWLRLYLPTVVKDS